MPTSIQPRRRIRMYLTAAFLLLVFPGFSRAQYSDREPNNSPGQAIQVPVPISTSYGEISPAGDVDYYSFPAEAGAEIIVWLHINSGLEPILAFYDSQERLLAYNDKEVNLNSGGSAVEPMLYLRIPVTGTYYLSVSSSAKFRNQQAGDTTGGYVLWMFPKAFWAGGSDINEPNDTRQTATPIALPFDSSNSNLIYLGDVDWYRITASSGEKISIDVEALEPGSHPVWPLTVVPHVAIFDESGHMLQEASPGEDPDDGYPDDPVLIFDVPRDGRYFIGVTTAADRHFGSVFSDGDFLADPYVSSTSNLIGYYQLRVRSLQSLFFPQVANGVFGSVHFTTSVILVNPKDIEIAGSITFFDSTGAPMEVTNAASGSAASTHWFRMAPGADFVFKTDGSGEGGSGYARVVATGAPGGSAIFSEYGSDGALITEAAVASSQPMDFFTFPVDVMGDFNTGIAIANPDSARTINIYLNLLDPSGAPVANRTLTLDAGHQTAVYVGGLGQLFPALTSFRGSLQVMADVALPAVALRSSARTLTTLPAVALDQSYDPVTLYFPQLVVGTAGASYRSTIVLSNPGYFWVSGTLRFTRSDGTPMPVSIESAAGGAIYPFSIPPHGTIFLESMPAESLMTGYAVLTADHGLGGVVIFSLVDAAGNLLTEAAVPPAPLSRDFLIFAQSDSDYNTGVALANVTPYPISPSYRLRGDEDPEHPMQCEPQNLEAGRHTAELLSGTNQLFPAFTGTGTLAVSTAYPIPAIALRLTATTMTAVPVVPMVK